MAAKQQLIKINSVDVSSKRISTEIQDEFQDVVSSATIEFAFSVNDLVTLSRLQNVEIWENYSGTLETEANRKFKGIISKIEREVGKIKVTAYSQIWKAIQISLTKTYDINIDPQAGVISEIFKDLCDEADLSYDSTTIQDSTDTEIYLDKFVCNGNDIFERMQTLAEILGWQFYYRSDTDKVYFEPIGYSTNNNIVYIGGVNNNVQGWPKWKEDATLLCNVVVVKGIFQEQEITETFNGTGSQDTFTILREPEIVYVTVGGIEQIGGVAGSTSNYDYTVDKKGRKIIFLSDSIPGGGSDNVSIKYSYRAPRNIIKRSEPLITEVGYEITRDFTFQDLQSIDDAENRADTLLAVYGREFLNTELKMKPSIVQTSNFKAGERVRIIDTRQGYDRFFTIRTMISRYPESDITIKVGDKENRVAALENDMLQRLKRLEEENSRSGTFLTYSLDLNKGGHKVGVFRKWFRLEKRNYPSDSFILGHKRQGRLGLYKLGGTMTDWVDFMVFWRNNEYSENFTTTDFKDTANSTCTWTTTGSSTFTSGQIAQSRAISKNNGTVTTATLTAIIDSGSFDLEMTADGTNWESVTSGVAKTFSNSGADLRWRATENAASTGEISSITISGY